MKDHHGPGALVSEVWPDDRVDGAGLELATELSRRSINALSGTKRMLLSGMESAHLEATVQSESQSQVLSNYWPELRESIARFNTCRRVIPKRVRPRRHFAENHPSILHSY